MSKSPKFVENKTITWNRVGSDLLLSVGVATASDLPANSEGLQRGRFVDVAVVREPFYCRLRQSREERTLFEPLGVSHDCRWLSILVTTVFK